MRFESMADMPQGMRQKAAPKIMEAVRTRIQAVDRNGHVMRDGIWFDNRETADRYVMLANLELAGVIRDLHVRENVTLADTWVYPGGVKHRQVRFQADFTYIPQLPEHYPPEIQTEETAWMEECASTCPGIRVYEVMHRVNAEALGMTSGMILRKVH